jgi:hypothetical protein
MNSTAPLDRPDRFHSYTLEVLPPESRLWIDRQHQAVLVLDGDCRIAGLEILTGSEWLIMLALLADIPPFCTYEKLYAAFYGMPYEQALEELREAWNSPAWEIMMRSVRNIISRLRIKIRTLGIEISNMSETGYTFIRAGRRFVNEKEG